MRKFVCVKSMKLNGAIIQPGKYNVLKDDTYGFCLIDEQVKRNSNIFASREELLKCGFFDVWKYFFSYAQSDGGLAVNYVFVDGEWKPYSECSFGTATQSNWDDAILVAESEEELPTRFSEYTIMEMEENTALFN